MPRQKILETNISLYLCYLVWIKQNLKARLQPHSRGLLSPHPKESEGRKTLVQAGHVSRWQIIFMGGVPIYQSIATATVCYLQTRLSKQPWKAPFRFRSENLSKLRLGYVSLPLFFVTSNFLAGTWPAWTRVFPPSLWGGEMKDPGNEVG